jgi:hypothetical protein
MIEYRDEMHVAPEPRLRQWQSGTLATGVGRIAARIRNAWHDATRGKPERRYERRVLDRLKAGDSHPTLGIEVRDAPYTRWKADRWLNNMIGLGLRPDDLCVEYGCGSLWGAEPVIRYMDPDRFIGLDVTDSFYEMGRRRLGALIDHKAVALLEISSRSLREVAQREPTFIFSRKVLPHVPRRALPRYFANIMMLMNEQTLVLIDNKPVPGPHGPRGGRHSIEDVLPHLSPSIECAQLDFGIVLRHTGRAAYSSVRPVLSRSRSYRLATGKGGSQDSRRMVQSS